MDIKSALAQVVEGRDLSPEAMASVMKTIMTGGATPAQIAGLLVALRMKGESVGELTGAAQVMRSLATGVDLSDLPHTLDIVGTGGDASSTFNISTASLFVAAAGGCHVAKHGNRSVSSQSGSADVLEAAGVRLDLKPEQVARCVREIGVGFLFAPAYHSAMRHAIGPRRELGLRTLFNLLGPLTNPARVPRQLLGVFSERWVQPLAEVLKRLGSRHALVVHALDGLDEISLSGETAVAELRDGIIQQYRIRPEDYGISPAPLSRIQVDSVQTSLRMLLSVLQNEPGPPRDIVMLNAGAALYVGGKAKDLAEGVQRADALIASGAAYQRWEQFIALTQSF